MSAAEPVPPSTAEPSVPAVARKPGRPRDARANRAILEATLELAAEHGLQGLSMDAVAAKAGVGKATIYRRWCSKEALVLDAWKELSDPFEAPDTGTLRGDLLTIFGHLADAAKQHDMTKVLPQMLAAGRVNQQLGQAFTEFLNERRQPTLAVVERAIARGELAAGTDPEVVADLVAGPLFYRILMTARPIDEALVARIIDVVLTGVDGVESAPLPDPRAGDCLLVDITIRWAEERDWPAAAQVDARNFGFQYSEQDLEDDKLILDRRRFLLAEDDGRVVGLTATSLSP